VRPCEKTEEMTQPVGVDADGALWTEEVDLSGYVQKSELPTKVSQLENDSKYITASGAPVQSINGQTGTVNLDATAVGARPSNWMPTAAEVGADSKGTAFSMVSAHNTATDTHNDIR
jgi:hypothetical protein